MRDKRGLMSNQETKEEQALHGATDKALKKYNDAIAPYWHKCQKALAAAWRQYEEDIAPFEQACNHEIARASRAYSLGLKSGSVIVKLKGFSLQPFPKKIRRRRRSRTST